MEKRHFPILGILLFLIAVSESGVIPDKKLGSSSGIQDPAVRGDDELYESDTGVNNPEEQPDTYDGKPEEDDNINEEDMLIEPKIKPENIPLDEDSDDNRDDENVNKGEDDLGKPGDDGFYEPFDGEEDSDKSVGDGKDSDRPADEDDEKPIDEENGGDDDPDKPKDEDEDESESSDDDDDEKKEHVPVNEESDEKDINEEGGDEEHHKDDRDISGWGESGFFGRGSIFDTPFFKKDINEGGDDEHHKDDKDISGWGESGFFGGGSIFDTPFFNLKQVQKYFKQLQRAVGHVFRETLDEAILLNGTYANTTEEEIDIGGKKYVVQKSIIKGADNHSSIYIEALTSKRKLNDLKGIKGIGVKNATA